MTLKTDLTFGAENITKNFGGAKALSRVSMKVSAGEVHCLAGENGSGKSTLIKIMSGVHVADSGLIRLGELAVESLTPREAVHAGVQVIFQDFSLLPNLTVAENIALPTLISRGSRFYSKKESLEIAERALELVGIDLDVNEKVVDIPVASKQLVAIARATNLGVRLLFMDEATTALTRKEIKKLFTVIDQLKARGVATVFVSHKIDEVQEICSTITVLRNGAVAADGLMKDFDRKIISTAMTGSEILETRMAPPRPIIKDEILTVSNLNSKGAFTNVNLSVTRGEIVGITGLLGSGRSELAEAIFGMQHVDSGEIKMLGVPIKLNSPKAALKAGIGYVPPDRLTQGLFLDQSIARNTIAAGISEYQNFLGLLNRPKLRAAASQWIKDLKIKTNDPSNPVSSLSGGNQQRVVLAKWLAVKPKILIFNGPTVGVDVGSKREILEIIGDWALQGMGFVIISDDIPELVQICHRVLVIRNGRLAAEITEENLTVKNLYQELN